MKTTAIYLLILTSCIASLTMNCIQDGRKTLAASTRQPPLNSVRQIGQLEDDRIEECSGMDISLTTPNLLWAINDGGNGPFIYALAMDGRSLGRVSVMGAQNRDWEGLDTFLWQGSPMILIADFGDNKEQHDKHTLYIIPEPKKNDQGYSKGTGVNVAWRIVFSYPDRKHDAEGVAVDAKNRKVYVLTKRDKPPLMYELPLEPLAKDKPIVARKVGEIIRIPEPSSQDLMHKYGKYRSQPTALDFSPDGLHAIVLTYKHAYLYHLNGFVSWGSAFKARPITIALPLPQDQSDLRQRESICFTSDGSAFIVSSEGSGAGIFKAEVR
jgi:hypothetical protein